MEDAEYQARMKDLLQRLRGLARYEHSDVSVALEAAECIEELDAELEEDHVLMEQTRVNLESACDEIERLRAVTANG